MKDDRKRREELLQRIRDAVLKVLSGYDYKARIVVSTDDLAEITDIHWRAYDQFLRTIIDSAGWETAVHKNAIRNNRDDVTQFELVLEKIIREFLSYEDGPHFITDITFLDLKPLDADRYASIESKLEQMQQSSAEQTDRLKQSFESSIKKNAEAQTKQLEDTFGKEIEKVSNADRYASIESKLEQMRQTSAEQTDRLKQSVKDSIEHGIENGMKHSLGKKIEENIEKSIEKTIEKTIERNIENRLGTSIENSIEKKLGKAVETQTKQIEERMQWYEKDLVNAIDGILEWKKDAIVEEIRDLREEMQKEIHDLREEMLDEFRSCGEQVEKIYLSAEKEEDAKLFYRSEITEEFLRIIKEAKEELVIVSPWIHGWYSFAKDGKKLRFGYDRYRTPLINAAKRGVRIHLAYGWNDAGGKSNKSNKSNRSDRNSKSTQEKSDELRSILATLKESVGDQTDQSGAYCSDSEKICLYEGDTHIKCVIMDNSYMLIGSCNLLSSDPAELSDRTKTHAEIMLSCTNPELIRKVREYCLTPGKKLVRITRPEEIGTRYIRF